MVIESALGGHNDTCMMLLALLAVWLHLRGCKAGAVVALALSALIKVITWPLVPLYVLMVLRTESDLEATRLVSRPRGDGRGGGRRICRGVLGADQAGRLTVHTASSAQFYENNYHELLFKGLR